MTLTRSRGIVAVVSDRRRLLPDGSRDAQARALVAQAVAAATAGADLFQVREHDLEARELAALVGEIVDAVAGSALSVLVNDRLDVALIAGAHGVHLPGSGLPAADARKIAPEGFLIGQSIHGTELPGAGVDFALFGTVFSTISKPVGHAPAGQDALALAARRATVPVLAIGGVAEETIDRVAARCDGVAAIGWFATKDARQLSIAVHHARLAFDTITRVI